MSKPDVIINTVSERYTRPDLVEFTRDSWQMKYDRSLWGKNKSVKRISFDELELTEDSVRKPTRRIDETIILRDSTSRSVNRRQAEVIEIVDIPTRKPNRLHEETIELSDDFTRKPNRRMEERLFIFDQDERQPNTVMYDVEFSETPLTDEDFEQYFKHSSPINYTEVRPLIPGEYEYKDAIVGVQIKVGETQGRYGIEGCKLVIDVEDVVVKGRVKLNGGTPERVKFDKKFYTIPHVLTSFVESSKVGVIEVSEVDREGFTVGIKPIDGTGGYLEGTIDYLADGY